MEDKIFMFKQRRLFALTSLGLILACCQGFADDADSDMDEQAESTMPAAKPAKQPVKVDVQKLSEAFGNFIGRNLQSPGLKFDMESLIKGIRAGAAGQPSPL